MEAKTPPVVVPMWLTGFDQLMPEGRRFPYKYFPRPGARLSVTFGRPISANEISQILANVNRGVSSPSPEQHIADVRHTITSILHREVEGLGRSVSGRLLGGAASGL